MFFDSINDYSVVLEASEGVVDVSLDLLGAHPLSDFGEDTEHAFCVFDLAVAFLLHLLDDFLFFLDVHHGISKNEQIFNGIAAFWTINLNFLTYGYTIVIRKYRKFDSI